MTLWRYRDGQLATLSQFGSTLMLRANGRTIVWGRDYCDLHLLGWWPA